MKCPKCGYLGFETGDRCRNCGYDFSFAGSFDLPDLTIAPETGRDVGPLPELTIGSDAPRPDGIEELKNLRIEERSEASPATRVRAPDAGGEDALLLPGFDAPDVALVKASRQPRAPLAVRRATPEVPRLRAERRTPPSIDFGFASDAPGDTPDVRAASPRSTLTPAAEIEPLAGVAHRLLAAVLDLGILAGLDLLVLYFTLRICGLAVAEIGLLPVVPLIGFFVVLNGGYLAAFTAGGQTIGKMAAGIRVVADEGEPLGAGRAVLRTLCWAVSAIPVGLGFLSILTTTDHRGLHDRFARTRVVATR